MEGRRGGLEGRGGGLGRVGGIGCVCGRYGGKGVTLKRWQNKAYSQRDGT